MLHNLKLYQDPAATMVRPIRLFIADHHLAVETIDLSLAAGDQHAPAYLAVNPNGAVPTIDDDGFVLTEAATILRYLATRIGSPTYPTEHRARARVDEALDWLNTGLLRDLGYGLVYPQALPAAGLPAGPARAAQLAAGRAGAARRLTVLDNHFLAGRDYLAGGQVTIADYLGAGIVSLADWIDLDLAPWRNVAGWMARMRARPAAAAEWARYDGFTASLRATIRPQAALTG